MQSTRPVRILLIDDSSAIRESIGLALKDEGYSVELAPNGKAALEKIQVFKPNVVLLDMKMPVMDGWSFAKELKKLADQDIKLVVFTAAVDRIGRPEDIQADGYIEKPCHLEEIFSEVRRVLEGKPHV